MAPSPFAKKKRPAAPPVKNSVSPPTIHRPVVPVAVGADDDWHNIAIESEVCKFDWELLNASNTDGKIDTIKCLVVGDLGVGKTSLCKTMLGDAFDAQYTPTVFETYKIRVPLFRQVMVELWDMSGNTKYDKKRPVIYPNVNCFLVCFDLTSREAWRNVKRKVLFVVCFVVCF